MENRENEVKKERMEEKKRWNKDKNEKSLFVY